MASISGTSQSIEPQHRAVAFVFVIVVAPRRREDQIAGLHPTALAVGAGVGAFALDDDAQRRRCVVVRQSGFAGKYQLDRARLD